VDGRALLLKTEQFALTHGYTTHGHGQESSGIQSDELLAILVMNLRWLW
jgi:hypothetical protein